MPLDKRTLDWNYIETSAKMLVSGIKHRGWMPDIICPIALGGLIPGAIVSYLLKIDESTPIRASSYDENNNQRSIDYSLPEHLLARLQNKKVLLVDDIHDTGVTLQTLRQAILAHVSCDLRTAVFIHKDKQAAPMPAYVNYAGSVIACGEQDLWIEFPWETADE